MDNFRTDFIALEIAARCNIFQVFWPGTPSIGQVIPSFNVPANHPWRDALHRLLEAYGLDYVIRADQSLVIHDPSEGYPSAWTFQNELTAWQLAQNDTAANHIRVFGAGAKPIAEVWDYASAQTIAMERSIAIADKLLASNAQAQIRASNELLQEQRKARGGVIHVPVNPGPEVLDVITVNDPDGGWNNTTFRIHTLQSHFDAEKGTYDMTLDLTAP